MGFLKKLRINYVADAVICMIIGLVLLLWPGVTMAVLCKALAVLLAVAGVGMIISFFVNKDA